ncbi:branched-chain alpha-keto acid dehydrogenase subunit E2 [Gemmobacter aquaticus]|uniref:Endolytic murein transglycosylase n=1 Tax=Gemmobacter aquaticus TaxID=490185 RepID=A0A918DBM3_9RHOB|nr:endolytic transglycosylase MltG [Gemmobacter aquaticus]GGO25669.1 branched-chain alpha-keto acid dehydrogenase subunit E2 [Gemmobacter aquaticus]
MWRSVASNALTLFIVLLIAAAGLLAWGRHQYSGPGPLSAAVCVKVDRGATLSQVSQNLAAKGAISDARIFRIGADYSGKAKGLKYGSYLVPAGASMAEIVDLLTAGGASTCGREVNYRIGVAKAEIVLRETDPATNSLVEVVKFDPAGEVPAVYTEAKEAGDLRWQITLAEGVTSWQVVNALKQADFLSGEVAEVPAEGSLAPDAYDVDANEDRGSLLAKMQAKQKAIIEELWPLRAEGLPYDTPEEAMVMASIVEKETGIAAERPMVASVFVNRLREGMKLQTDPTVIYGITKGEGVLGRGLRASELRRATPYNTYLIEGLPPGPIANPGRLSIEATLHPASSDYLYFVADGTGGHVFAKTLAEHNQNVAKWREIEAQQREQQNAPEGGGN